MNQRDNNPAPEPGTSPENTPLPLPDPNYPRHPGSGWNFLRVVGFVLALFSMIGFGVCSLCGLVISGGNTDFLGFVAIGTALTVGAIFWLNAILSRVRKP